MDRFVKQKVAAVVVVGIAVIAVICIMATLTGSIIYLGGNANNSTTTATATIQPGASATPTTTTTEPTSQAAASAAPTIVVTPSTTISTSPLQSKNPFSIIDPIKADRGSRTYTITLSLTPGSRPAQFTDFYVNLTHAGKDYGTVWAPDYSFNWVTHNYIDDGALHGGDALSFQVNVGALGIPLDNERSQLTIMYEGQAATTLDLDPV